MNDSDLQLAVLLTALDAETVRPVLRRYREQGDPRRLEIVVVAPGKSIGSPEELGLEGFGAGRVIDVGEVPLCVAEGIALRAATAPLVIFAQAHAFPLPGFVDAVFSAWREGSWAAIGPRMSNANPLRAASRATMRMHFGGWITGGDGVDPSSVPGHNSVFDRAALLELGADLEEVLEAGCALLEALVRRGGRMCRATDAGMRILLPSRLPSYFADLFRQGRIFAARRCLGWSRSRRLLCTVASPAIPLIRLTRMTANERRAGPGGSPTAFLLLVAGLVASAAGEACGCALGRGDRPARRERSLRRFDDLTPAERPLD